VKIMQDGIPENFTAAMIDPYLDRGGPPKGRGLSFVDPEALKGYVTRLDREGFQVHVHAIGDRAVREALDAFEAANVTVDRRHHIAHIEVVHPDDIERFAALQVVPNAQPYWACFDPQMRELVEPYLGPERTSWQYPFASLLASGARMAMGSDWPVSSPNPMEEIQVALTRRYPDEEVFFPEQRIGLADALDAFTLGSAFVNHLDDRTGTIEAGKLADLAVMDRDLFDTHPTELDQAQVLLTLVEGQPVHSASDLGW
jgi:predicted amidohydrolase YtcJ